MLRLARNFFLGLLACGATAFSLCQGITTGTVLGVVTDPSGAVVPGAQIQITDLATGVKLDVKSGARWLLQVLCRSDRNLSCAHHCRRIRE